MDLGPDCPANKRTVLCNIGHVAIPFFYDLSIVVLSVLNSLLEMKRNVIFHPVISTTVLFSRVRKKERKSAP